MNPRVPISPVSSERLPPGLEAKLLAAAARIFRTDFPNAERTDCPAQETLRSVARKAAGGIESRNVMEHLTFCSPCFAEYERLMHQARVWKSTKLLALCAMLLITAGLATWFYGFRADGNQRAPEPPVAKEGPFPRQIVPDEFAVAVLDLRDRSPVRGDQKPTPNDDVAALPARRLELSVYLPVGSEEGSYEMQILRDPDSPLVTQTGTASLRDQNVVVTIRADFTGISSGRYLLRLRRETFGWRYYAVSVTP